MDLAYIFFNLHIGRFIVLHGKVGEMVRNSLKSWSCVLTMCTTKIEENKNFVN